MSRYVALLRGINVGGHRRVAMADLRALMVGLGFEDVQTLLQSGNAVFGARGSAERVRSDLERGIAAELGMQIDVVVRSGKELAEVIERNPLGDVANEPKRYQVSFLSASPDPKVIAELEALDVAPERVVPSGREIYAWHPEGVHNSRLAKLLSDRRLGVTATARNWNTVLKLHAMVDES
jgi:uncharacterized protein (DUF1697 family)